MLPLPRFLPSSPFQKKKKKLNWTFYKWMHLFLIPAPPPTHPLLIPKQSYCKSTLKGINVTWKHLKKNRWPTVVELPCLCFSCGNLRPIFVCLFVLFRFWVGFSLFFCPLTISHVLNVYSSRDSRTLSTFFTHTKKMNPLPCFFPDVCSKLLYFTFLIVTIILRIRLRPVAPFLHFDLWCF